MFQEALLRRGLEELLLGLRHSLLERGMIRERPAVPAAEHVTGKLEHRLAFGGIGLHDIEHDLRVALEISGLKRDHDVQHPLFHIRIVHGSPLKTTNAGMPLIPRSLKSFSFRNSERSSAWRRTTV